MPVNRLVNASQSPRCQHLKANGARCGSPARHGRPYCCFHDSAARRNGEFVLPIIEDAASLQLALNKILQALIDKLIDQKTASILLYGLQIASANLKQLKGEQRLDDLERHLRAQNKQAQPQPGQAFTNPDRPITRPPDHPIASAHPIHNEPRFDINACIDTVPQGRTLVAQDGSPGTPSSTRPESRRDGAIFGRGLKCQRRLHPSSQQPTTNDRRPRRRELRPIGGLCSWRARSAGPVPREPSGGPAGGCDRRP